MFFCNKRMNHLVFMVYIYHPLTPGYVHVAVKVKTKSAYWKMYSGIPTIRTSKGNKIGSKNQRVWEMGGGGKITVFDWGKGILVRVIGRFEKIGVRFLDSTVDKYSMWRVEHSIANWICSEYCWFIVVDLCEANQLVVYKVKHLALREVL